MPKTTESDLLITFELVNIKNTENSRVFHFDI